MRGGGIVGAFPTVSAILKEVFRRFAAMLIAAAVLLPGAVQAQDSDEAWTALIMKALYAHGAKDYAKSEQLFLDAVQQAEKFGPYDARVGATLNDLGLAYRDDHKYNEAEGAYRRALPVLERAYGPTSMDVANVNFNIASVIFDQGNQAAAIPFAQKARSTYEVMLGPNSLKTAQALCMEGDAYRAVKDYASAEGPLRRCSDIQELSGGIRNADFARALHSLAMDYVGQGKFALAEPRFSLSEKVCELTLGITSPELAQTMEDHAALLKELGRERESDRLVNMASAIRRLNARPAMARAELTRPAATQTSRKKPAR